MLARGLEVTRDGGEGTENIIEGPGPSSVATVVRGTRVEERRGKEDWRMLRGRAEGRRCLGNFWMGASWVVVVFVVSFFVGVS